MKNLYTFGRGKELDKVPYRLTDREAKGYLECRRDGVDFVCKRLGIVIPPNNMSALEPVLDEEVYYTLDEQHQLLPTYVTQGKRFAILSKDGKRVVEVENDEQRMISEDNYIENWTDESGNPTPLMIDESEDGEPSVNL